MFGSTQAVAYIVWYTPLRQAVHPHKALEATLQLSVHWLRLHWGCQLTQHSAESKLVTSINDYLKSNFWFRSLSSK